MQFDSSDEKKRISVTSKDAKTLSMIWNIGSRRHYWRRRDAKNWPMLSISGQHLLWHGVSAFAEGPPNCIAHYKKQGIYTEDLFYPESPQRRNHIRYQLTLKILNSRVWWTNFWKKISLQQFPFPPLYDCLILTTLKKWLMDILKHLYRNKGDPLLFPPIKKGWYIL